MICRRHIRTYKGELKDVFRAAFNKKKLIGNVALFERKFADYVGRKHAIAVCSGRQGLELLLDAYGVGDGDEVIFPAYTLKDLIILTMAKGIKPVLVDISENTYNINVGLIEEKITPKTKAIIATHMFGSPCDIIRITEIADKHNIIVIEDCAHSLGSKIQGKQTGCFGDAAFFSLELTKSVNTFGGGVVVTDNDRIAGQIRKKVEKFLCQTDRLFQKISSAYFEKIFIKTLFFNMFSLMFYFDFSTKIINIIYRFTQHSGRIKRAKFTDLQALVGLRQLKTVDELNFIRAGKAQKMISRLDGRIRIQQNLSEASVNFYFFTIRLDDFGDAKVVRKQLIGDRIDTGIESEIADDCSFLLRDCYSPVASKIFRSLIQLPLHEDLSDEEIVYIVDACNKTSCILLNKENQ